MNMTPSQVNIARQIKVRPAEIIRQARSLQGRALVETGWDMDLSTAIDNVLDALVEASQ